MNDYRTPGKIILLNGASSAGKSTLARLLQQQLHEPFLHLSFDHLRESNALPMARIQNGELDWYACVLPSLTGNQGSECRYDSGANGLVKVEWVADVELLNGDLDPTASPR
jgi:chloramphenicol 3-O phosphotransferase